MSVTNKARINALVNSAIDRLAENGDTYISIEQIASQISSFQQAYPKLDTRYILMNAKVNKKYILTGNGYAVQQRILAEKMLQGSMQDWKIQKRICHLIKNGR